MFEETGIIVVAPFRWAQRSRECRGRKRVRDGSATCASARCHGIAAESALSRTVRIPVEMKKSADALFLLSQRRIGSW